MSEELEKATPEIGMDMYSPPIEEFEDIRKRINVQTQCKM